MKANQIFSAVAVAAALTFTSTALLAEDAGKTATSGGASVGSATNETPKPDGHGQKNSKNAPVAAGSTDNQGTRNPGAAVGDAKPGSTSPITTPGTSTGSSVGSSTLEAPKPEGHGQTNSKSAPVAAPQSVK